MNIANFKFDTRVLEKNKMKIGYIAISVIFAWFGYAKIYQPGMSAVGGLKTEISNEDIKKGVSFKMKKLQDSLDGYKTYFTSGQDVSWLINKVSAAAKESGLEITALNPQKMIAMGDFLYCRVNVTLSGNYHQLGDFVAKIEDSKELVRIDNILFKKKEDALSAEAVVSSYFWKGPG